MTFEEMMRQMLASIPEDVDKREDKSLIWHTLGPSAALMAETWAYGDNIHDGSIPDNEKCAGAVLTRKCGEHGVNRYPATSALRRGTFADFGGNPATINLGEQFTAESVVYAAAERISAGEYRMQCREDGIIGNIYFGPILPLDSRHQLGTATLGDVLVPGEEEETDEALRARFYIEVNALPFGGNVDQYTKWVLDIPGVGNTKIFPTPNNQGGRVHIVIVDPENKPISTEFMTTLQELIDPAPHGKGMGTAPIGHRVTISTVEELQIDVATVVQLVSGFALASVLVDIKEALTSYLARLSFVDNTVRVAHVEAAVLSVSGVKDIAGTTLCGLGANITLNQWFDSYQVPTLGELAITEG